MSITKIAGLLLSSASMVAAHGYVSGAVVDGTYHKGFIVDTYNYMSDVPENIGWAEDATDLGFVDGSGYSGEDIICHKDATPGAISADVKAGGKVELQWTEWPESHHGPVITYLANCNGDCSSVDKTALEFFKIDEAGLIDDSNVPGTWASDNLISANNSWTVTIPSSIAAGNYVLRHEIIALHSAGETNGAQNYPQCLNLKVTGGGSDSPSGTKGTALYKNTDAGIKVNIYTSMDSYEIPGPALYSGASSGSSTAAASTAAATTAAAATQAATTQAATTAAPAAASSVSVAPIQSSSSFSHPQFSRTRTLPRPTPSSSPAAVPSAPSYSNPSGSDAQPTGAPAVETEYATETLYATQTVGGTETVYATETRYATQTVDATKTVQAAAQVTDEPDSQTASAAADSVTVTATAVGGQSAQSSTPASGSDSSSEASSTAAAVATPSSTSAADYSTYLSSLSADQLLTVVRSTLKWLVSDNKVHARDLSS
ncbi:unnamed protein product [Penicillium salamii]|uniref:Auxiliary Activity family 9 catalytic domain-containing protein n=1 Tax=Penicillium salamii TaxID=1612424 RepID=A0A9W4JBC5_9EURO|nr:unnamed protein product [Penicillium salamii]CAG8362516.1 unnamed protein product [Penicillium salamii]CAG8369406.1 unnamed protein product [Penicillium salamii]CAG8390590.1 unnamed protein product [Penicillium salamii]